MDLLVNLLVVFEACIIKAVTLLRATEAAKFVITELTYVGYCYCEA